MSEPAAQRRSDAGPEAVVKPSGADGVSADGKPKQSKLQKFITRACMGVVMFSVFSAIIWAGHLYVCMLVVMLQVCHGASVPCAGDAADI